MKFLVYLIVGLFSTLGYVYLYCKLSGSKFKLNLRVSLIIGISVLSITFLKFYNLNVAGTLIYFLFYPVIFYSIEHFNFKKLFYYVFIVWLIGIILDFSSMLILLFLQYVYDINVSSSIYVIAPTLYVLVMIVILGKIKFLKKYVNLLYKVIAKIKYVNAMLFIFTTFVLFLSILMAINISNLDVSLLVSVVAILVIIIFAILIRIKYSELENSIFVDILRKNNDFYVSMNKEQNIFKHNLISKLLSIESVSDKKTRMLIKDLINEFNSNIDYSNRISDIPYGLDGIINEKIYSYNDKLEIKVDNKIKIDIFDVLKPRRYNVLIEKLSIILDNAIEACVNSTNKILIINMYEKDKQIIVEVKNSFSGSMSIDDIGKINYSSKGKKRGFGLYSALRNNEVNLEVKVVNHMFVAKMCANKNLNIE